ncbi:MAG: cupin domain-containing protein [Candidatus Kariarchaeaceae archaeon]|jgi:mannose-6-phosphate isomerase-like protein (cupin superfamily)
MIEQVFNAKDKPWQKQKTGRTKYLIEPDVLKNCSLRLYSLTTDEHFESHDHNFTQIMYFTSGKGKVSIDDQIYEITPGLTVIVLPNQCHSVINTGQSKLEIMVVESYSQTSNDTPFIDF